MTGVADFLTATGIAKRYGGVQALKTVDFSLRRGEVHCLVGENGSGKSTLIKIIAGVVAPDPGGTIVIAGETVAHLTPHESMQRGIQVIYQDLSLFPNLSVAENIGIAAHLRHPVTGVMDKRRIRRAAEDAMAKIGVGLDPRRIVETLSIASRQIVAICRAIAADAQLVIMDEPTASLTRQEVDALLRVVVDLRARGIGTMFVSHRLGEVLEIAERVTVLRDGAKVGTFDAAGMTDHKLSVLMTGREFHYDLHERRFDSDRVVLDVKALSRRGEFHDIGFKVHAGEILGIIGLLGSGRTELALSIFGANPPDAGTVTLDGHALRLTSNRDAIEHGIAYVSEDRLTLGLVMNQSIGANIILTVLQRLTGALGLISPQRRRAEIARWIEGFGIKVGNPDNAVSTLSGGNQQRVVLAKWMATSPKLLILDSPTVGVDIAAKNGIYDIVKNLAATGVAVILISDEIPEVLYHTHRILLMRDGRFVGEYAPHATSEERLGHDINA